MGEAKRRIKIGIDQERLLWSYKIPQLQEWVSELKKVLELMTGDEGHYTDLEDDLRVYQGELERLLELSKLSDQELHKLYSKQGFLG